MSVSGAPEPVEEAGRREAIFRLLRRVADPDGFVPFDRFMDVALYGEGAGYYARSGSPFGRRGDFYTAAHASPLFGRTIAERIRSALAAMPPRPPARIVELGPGDGTLGEAVVQGLSAGPRLSPGLEYVLVERATSRAREGFERVSAAGRAAGIGVRVSNGIGADGPFRGVVLANELLDAQPVRRLVWDGARWQEAGMRLDEDGLRPAMAACVRAVPSPSLPEGVPEGSVVEVSPMAEAIVREVADHLTAGVALFFDFGMDQSELLAAHPSGTLAAVQHHRPVHDLLADPGSADISAFVNFDRIRAVARASGLEEVAFRRQAEALGEWGLPKLLEEAVGAAPSDEMRVRIHLAAKNLLFGFERFYSLELAPPSAVGGVPPGRVK